MKEYIELGAAIKKIRDEGIYGEGHSDEERENDVIRMLEQLPAADVVERKRGEWVQIGYDKLMDRITCSCCNEYFSTIDNCTEQFNFCPNCGADMRQN